MVVITVQAKNRDCPKLQLGSPETFLAAETPLLLADKTSFIKFSIESSEKKVNLIKLSHLNSSQIYVHRMYLCLCSVGSSDYL